MNKISIGLYKLFTSETIDITEKKIYYDKICTQLNTIMQLEEFSEIFPDSSIVVFYENNEANNEIKKSFEMIVMFYSFNEYTQPKANTLIYFILKKYICSATIQDYTSWTKDVTKKPRRLRSLSGCVKRIYSFFAYEKTFIKILKGDKKNILLALHSLHGKNLSDFPSLRFVSET